MKNLQISKLFNIFAEKSGIEGYSWWLNRVWMNYKILENMKKEKTLNDILGKYIPEAMEIYGRMEVRPFLKSQPQEVFVPYSIRTADNSGTVYEWGLSEVIDWTKCLLIDYPELANKIRPAEDLCEITVKGKKKS